MSGLGTWFENGVKVLAGISVGTETTYTASGAIAPTDHTALLDSSSSSTIMTLADGAIFGQEMVIVAQGGDVTTVTIASAITSTTDVITFSDGDVANLRWTSMGWAVNQGITIA